MLEAQVLHFMNCSGRNMEFTIYWANKQSKSTKSYEVNKYSLFPKHCTFSPPIDLSSFGIAEGTKVQLEVKVNLLSNPLWSSEFIYQQNEKAAWFNTLGRTGSHIKLEGPSENEPPNTGGKN